MGYARHIGRVGALAVTLGVGAAIANAPGIAYADKTGTSQNGDSSQKTTSSTPDTSSTTGQPTSPTDGAAADVGDPGRRPRIRSRNNGDRCCAPSSSEQSGTSLTSLTALLPRAMPPAQPADSASRIRRAAIRPTARHRTSRQLPPEPAPAQSHSSTRPRTCSRRSTRSPNTLRRPSSNSAHPGRTTRQPHRSTQRRRHLRRWQHRCCNQTHAHARASSDRHEPSWRIAEAADVRTVGRRHCRRRH